LAISIGRNIIHGSDSFESANDEIGLWFTDAEINEWNQLLFENVVSALAALEVPGKLHGPCSP